MFVLAAVGLLNYKSSKKSVFFLCALPVAYVFFYLVFTWLDAREYLPFYGTQRAISYKVVSAENNQDRIEIWKSAFQLIQQYPWFGVGFGMLAIRSGLETSIGRLDVYIDYAHNLPLQWALEFGLPAMLALLSLLAYTLWQLRAMLKNSEGRLLAAFLGLPLLHEMVEFPLHYLLFLLPWCFVLGYCLAIYKTHNNQYLSQASNVTPLNSKKVITRWVVLPIVLLAASLFAVQDAKKAAILYDPVAAGGVENAIKKTYSTVAFQNVVDYAMVQIVPVTKENASTMHRLVAAASQLKFDYLMAAIYIRAAALDNKMCTAKSIAYRVNNADAKSKQTVFEQIRKWEEPVFRDLENYLRAPYFIPWSKSLPENC